MPISFLTNDRQPTFFLSLSSGQYPSNLGKPYTSWHKIVQLLTNYISTPWPFNDSSLKIPTITEVFLQFHLPPHFEAVMVEGGSPLPLYRDSPAYQPKVDPLSEEALIHLKSYKYSSVDKSWISHYILRHYV